MEEIGGKLSDPSLNMSEEEILLGTPERNYVNILRGAHSLLLPKQRFAYDVVNECNMIKVAIKDLTRSKRSEAEKYAILLQLAAEAGLQVDPRFSLWEIGSAVQDYYMNTCLAINPEVANKLALLWGLGIRQQVKSYASICRSIQKKMADTFSFNWAVPRHVITILYDPEIGLVSGSEWKQRPNYRLVDQRSHEEDRAKMHASDIIIWKITTPNDYQNVYDHYEGAYGGDIRPSNYISRNPEVTPNEAEFFRNYHKYNSAGTPYRITSDDILRRFNDGAVMTAQERIQGGEDEKNVILSQLTPEEAEFILMVQQKFISGEYPIDMLWEDICSSF